ncbi:MAG: hypothetical protein JWN07_1003 [Hyphomicrobiales bacterium]|nr:hypothetical protein [Hyphomicrobiales bacterium]
MNDLSHIKAILADDVTRAVLRADGLDPREFLRTLEAAALRIGAARAKPAPGLHVGSASWYPRVMAAMPRCGA